MTILHVKSINKSSKFIFLTSFSIVYKICTINHSPKRPKTENGKSNQNFLTKLTLFIRNFLLNLENCNFKAFLKENVRQIFHFILYFVFEFPSKSFLIRFSFWLLLLFRSFPSKNVFVYVLCKTVMTFSTRLPVGIWPCLENVCRRK